MNEESILETKKMLLERKIKEERDFYDVLELEDDYNELLRGYFDEGRGFSSAKQFLEKINDVFNKIFEKTSEGEVLSKSFSKHLEIMEVLRENLKKASSVLEKAKSLAPQRGKEILLPKEYAKFLTYIAPVYRYIKGRSGENLIQLNYCIRHTNILPNYLKRAFRIINGLKEGEKVHLYKLEEDVMIYLIDNFNSDGRSPLKRALKSFKKKEYDKVCEILFSEVPSEGIFKYINNFSNMYEKIIESLKLRRIFDDLCRARISIWDSIEDPAKFLEYVQQLYEIFHPLPQYV